MTEPPPTAETVFFKNAPLSNLRHHAQVSEAGATIGYTKPARTRQTVSMRVSELITFAAEHQSLSRRNQGGFNLVRPHQGPATATREMLPISRASFSPPVLSMAAEPATLTSTPLLEPHNPNHLHFNLRPPLDPPPQFSVPPSPSLLSPAQILCFSRAAHPPRQSLVALTALSHNAAVYAFTHGVVHIHQNAFWISDIDFEEMIAKNRTNMRAESPLKRAASAISTSSETTVADELDLERALDADAMGLKWNDHQSMSGIVVPPPPPPAPKLAHSQISSQITTTSLAPKPVSIKQPAHQPPPRPRIPNQLEDLHLATRNGPLLSGDPGEILYSFAEQPIEVRYRLAAMGWVLIVNGQAVVSERSLRIVASIKCT
ncbi:hypothetical protein HDU79_004413 [Rhizoclosmatium sp. JEL0117]|nr:hypothetical protein HDU79_004413 [Rhizoclosmatium sp. JEL0117]